MLEDSVFGDGYDSTIRSGATQRRLIPDAMETYPFDTAVKEIADVIRQSSYGEAANDRKQEAGNTLEQKHSIALPPGPKDDAREKQ